MTRLALAAALAFVAGCTCSGEERDLNTYVPPAYREQVAACAQQQQCSQLCITTFKLTSEQELESCSVNHVDSAGGARLHAQILDFSVCGTDPSADVASSDDGTDDGNDSSDDGSSDDGGDSGGDGGDSGDDGDSGDSGRRAPHVSYALVQVNRAGE